MKKIFLTTNDHPQRLAAMKPAIESGLAVAIETNETGTLYEVPDAEYKRLMKVKRYHDNQRRM